MPKIQITDTKGLVQSSGAGVEHTAAASGFGFHRWVQELDIAYGADDACVARVGMYIPAQARIMNAHIISTKKSAGADASVALEVHNADIAVDEPSGGTEIIGADEPGTKSLPNSDLNIGTGDVLNDSVHMGTLAPIIRGANKSYFQLAAKEDMRTTATYKGDAKVTVIIEWFGLSAVALS